MKLTLEGISSRSEWEGYKLPNYDIPAMCEETKEHPVWMHFGSGNIFRAFLCSAAQSLLDKAAKQTEIEDYKLEPEIVKLMKKGKPVEVRAPTLNLPTTLAGGLNKATGVKVATFKVG